MCLTINHNNAVNAFNLLHDINSINSPTSLMKLNLIFRSMALLLFVLISTEQYAQTVASLHGKVIQADGKPLLGVTVSVNGHPAVQTQADGSYRFPESISLPTQVHFQIVGYQPKKIAVDALNWHQNTGLVVQLFEGEVQVDEILVTGRRNNSYLINQTELGGKFACALKELPQSVSLVSRELMEDRQAFVITDMVQDLAGVNQASAYDDLTIRGFNSGYTTGFRLVNGMRSGYGYGTSFWRTPLTANLESIEVLKGPGASLFGDIAPGGTVNLVTKKPLEDRHGAVSFSLGSFQTFRSSLDIGGALDTSKRILYRLNVAHEDSRTFRDKNSRTSILIAPSFTFKPVEGTQIDVDATYDNFDGYLDRGLGIRNNDFFGQSRAYNVNQASDFLRTNFLTFAGRLTQQITPSLSLHASYMKSIYKEELNEFRTLNTYANPPENSIMNMRFQSKQATDYTDNVVGYLRYALDRSGHQHRFVLGIDYAGYGGDPDNILREARLRQVGDSEVPLTIDLNAATQPVIDVSSYVWRPQAEFPFLNPYKSYGFYVQDQVSIADRLQLIFGLRHEYYRSSSADLQSSFSTSQNVWLPRAGLTFIVNPQINYFASYSKGYIPVGADFIHNFENYGADRPFVAEDSYQVETGFKTGFFQNQLQTELSVFHIARRNMLLATGAQSEAGFPVYRQSGHVISQGVELDLRGQISREFQLMANYTFNHTEVRASNLVGEEGQPLSNAPRNMAGVWLKYLFSDTKLKGLGMGVGVNYVDRRRMDNAARTDESGMMIWDQWPSYTVANAALYYHIHRLRVSVNMNNIFDRYYYLGGFDYTRGFVGTPRNVLFSIGYNW